MNSKSNQYSDKEKTQKNSQFSEHGVYVREDDQDWGSAGMNNIEEDLNEIQ
jgi:hypothetical protein